MAYQFTLADAKRSSLRDVSAACPDSQQFIDLVNKAQRKILKRGEWFGTEFLYRFSVNGIFIVWPRFVKTIYGVRFCECCHDNRPASIFNNHFNYVGPHIHRHGFHSTALIEDANPVPCYNEVSSNTGKYVQYYVVKRNDVVNQKTIRLYGSEYGGQELREQVSGVWVPGITLTAAAPFSETTKLITRISSVIRDPTEGAAYLFERDPATGLLRDLASYQPDETNPQYKRSKIVACPLDLNQGNCNFFFEALVKLRFVPVNSDRDFLLIDDFDALEYAIQSIKAEQAGDNTTGEIFMTKAIREMNMTDRENLPDDQVPVRVNVFAGGHRVTSL